MSKNQHNTQTHRRRKKFGDEITTGFILACLGSVILFGAALVVLMRMYN
jgi:hypothetical protein